MQARDLVTRDVREGGERFLKDLVEDRAIDSRPPSRLGGLGGA